MICPKCRTDVPTDAAKCPGCSLVTPRGRDLEAVERKQKAEKKKQANSLRLNNSSSRSRQKFEWKTLNWKDPQSWQAMAAAVPRWAVYVVFGLFLLGGGYFAYGYIYSPPPKEHAQAIMTTINQTKNRPSKKDGSTLDQALKDTLKKSKEDGNLVSYQGWSCQSRDNGSFMVTFAFEEKDGRREASWLVDTTNNQFIPQTELAVALSR